MSAEPIDEYTKGVVRVTLVIEKFGAERGHTVTDVLHPGEDTATGYAECMGRLRRSVLLAVESGRLPSTKAETTQVAQ